MQASPDGARDVRYSVDTLNDGGLATLQAAMERDKPRLIVIDTFRASPGAPTSRMWRDDGDPVQPAAGGPGSRAGPAVHRPPPKGLRAADGGQPHRRHPGQHGEKRGHGCAGAFIRARPARATLRIIGREMDERELALKFDGWRCAGLCTARGRAGAQRFAIIEYPRSDRRPDPDGEIPTRPDRLAPGWKKSNVSQLQKMIIINCGIDYRKTYSE